MFFAVIIELGPFLFMYAILIFFFSLFQIILSADVSEGDSDYPGVHPFFRMLIQTLRISVGDIKVSTYSKWADKDKKDHFQISSIAKNLYSKWSGDEDE